ncbi:MAG: tRNA (adenosine(37)-N6)-threonylcarbamoyltransferase complex ATPase subunit type 1 TsaE [Rhodospirillaceae bacterium]
MTSLSLTSETETLALGAALAKHATSGDVITLSGTLGAGKTVLARGFITERLGKTTDIASPTFTLVHVYDTVTPEIWHFDWYRLKHPDEVQELGVEDAFASGLSLIEWPEKAAAWLPRDRLDITLTIDPKTAHRVATLKADPIWSDRLKNLDEVSDVS